MFEGAQGALLDVDVGTYPFVTSSNTIAGEAAVGTGLGPRDIHAVLGIVKAYTTRVGAGPFPTELFDETGEHLSRVGHEFGAVTGRAASLRLVRRRGAAPRGAAQQHLEPRRHQARRARRARHAAHLHGLSHRRRGARRAAAAAASVLDECVPVYEEHPGWSEPTHGIVDFAKLPATARSYLARMEELAAVPIDIVSTGADRTQTIVLRHPYD